jgi:methionine-rich copper-binding protein CopC
MRSRTFLAVAFACVFAAKGALAHAFLDHSVPGVGSTVSASPGAIELTFTQEIVPAFSGAQVASVEGAAVATGKATVDPGNPHVLRLGLGHALKPGVYVVSWHVVSVDTHRTTGTYKFTVAP